MTKPFCDRYGILLIFDEVITAYGRLGKASAAEYFDVKPDIITTAKGLTDSVVPMGAVILDKKIYDSAMENADAPIELFHGYTYSAHPVAVAAAFASIETYKQDGLFERADGLAGRWQDAVHSLKGLPNVKDMRNLGLVAGIELESRQGAVGARATEAMNKAWDAGLMIRVTGDIIALSPPLIISEDEIDMLFGKLADILKTID